MTKYQIVWKKSAVKDIKSLPIDIKTSIFENIANLADNPFNFNVKKLVSLNNYYRLRVNNYRIVFKIEKEQLIVLIVAISHRKEIYKKL